MLWVALGGAVGSSTRYLTNIFAARLFGDGFPWGTFIVNLLGSFLIGLITAVLMRKMAGNDTARLFLTTGFLGGFTTFSAFSIDTFNLMQSGNNSTAAIYVVATTVLAIGSVFAGFAVARVAF